MVPTNGTPGAAKPKRAIAINATFTAELIEEPLRFWMDELDLACEIGFGPYNQVFQQLLDPGSLFASNPGGLNVVLIRLEDWWRGAEGENGSRQRVVERNAEDFIAALGAASKRSSVPYLVCLCPAGRQMQNDQPLAEFFARAEKEIADGLRDDRGVHVVTSAELASLYPVHDYEDLRADEVGHVPYTQEFFTALATMVARRFFRLHTAPHKVIVLDCDNTLWRGVCGEEGARGVRVDAAARNLQEFVIAQRNAGMVLCLCSKNNEEDVWKVFEENPGMLLRRSDIVASRINWEPKSENLLSLAAELQLGIDSFVFLDDSAIECAEVQARCPDVLALQVPEAEPMTSKFLAHVWALDHLKVTEEDRRRTDLYIQNTEREALKKKSMSLDDFLAGLELQLEIAPMGKSDLARVSQLTHRTNQFNFTTIRRSESDVEKLCEDGKAECMVVKLRDRFGDYGTVGAMICSREAGVLDVDTMLLSCRALGRRVEQRMLAELGLTAQKNGIERVRINFVPSEKNKPARQFLEGVGAEFEQPDRPAYSWELPASILVSLPTSMPSSRAVEEEVSEPAKTNPATGQNLKRSKVLGRIANQLGDPVAISRAIASRRSVARRANAGYVAPSSPFEETLASLWAEFLKIDKVGAQDNFFELGGQSLTAMQIAFKIQEEFSISFTLEAFLQTPILADQARRLEEELIQGADTEQIERLLNEMESVPHPANLGSLEEA